MSTATPRIFIVGTSESGKSLLAKSVAVEAEKHGEIITVYDPVLSEWSENAFVTCDPTEFFEEIEKVYKSGKRQKVFIDEADTLMAIGDKQNHWLLTRGRHYGLEPFLITQRPALVAPTVRTQCNQAFVFQLSKDDARLMSDDFAHDDLLQAPSLLQGEFLHVRWQDKKRVVDKGRVF
jgi:DNA helicase HerA-like ATPase